MSFALHEFTHHFDLISNLLWLLPDIGVYDLCHVFHGDIVQIPISSLNEHFDLCVQISDHVCVVFLLGFGLVLNVYEHADFRVTVQEFAFYDLSCEIAQQFVCFLGVVKLVIDTVCVVFKQVVSFGIVD